MTLGMYLCSACNRRTTNTLDDDNVDDDEIVGESERLQIQLQDGYIVTEQRRQRHPPATKIIGVNKNEQSGGTKFS